MVNPLLNPKNAFYLLKNYFFDPGRLKRLDTKQIKKFQNKQFSKIINYAFSVPMYKELYKKAGVQKDDINCIEDIVKLPMISKKDLRNYYPNGLYSQKLNKENAYVICTGGTTGKSVSIYTDFLTLSKSYSIFLREIRDWDLNWRKSRFANIGNFNECRIDLVGEENFTNHLDSFFSLDNTINIDVNLPVKKIIKKLNSFKPDYIISYPAVFQNLAYLKRKGYGENFSPVVMFSCGAMLDNYTKKYVEDVFKSPLLNTYQSVEAQSVISTECRHGTWHVHDDFFYLEAIDEKGNLVEEGELGHIVLTRLWGRGTPIIRYTGMDDYIKIIKNYDCKCGLSTSVIYEGVKGRKRANIVLPNGKVFPPGAFCFIEPVLAKYKSYQIKQYQIVQKKIDEIDILVVVDEDLRNQGVSFNQIKKEILENYRNKTGPEVKLNIKEVNEIKNKKNARKPPPIVVSHVKQKF